MFGQDNHQQPGQVTDDVFQAAMPDPLAVNNGSAPDVSLSLPDPAGAPASPTADTPVDTPVDTPADNQVGDDRSSPTADDLLTMKQDALQMLSPLVGQLDQSPEEKFRTTMMMIQAADDQTLLKSAYDTAKQITDEKARAQALLDVVNEINYFTQQHNNAT